MTSIIRGWVGVGVTVGVGVLDGMGDGVAVGTAVWARLVVFVGTGGSTATNPGIGVSTGSSAAIACDVG
jgi:hypothetical protein